MDPEVAKAAGEAFDISANAADRIFLARHHTKEGTMKVKEDDGRWRSVTLYRHRIMTERVVLSFGDGEYEGIGDTYSFTPPTVTKPTGMLTDGDGDKITFKQYKAIRRIGVSKKKKKDDSSTTKKKKRKGRSAASVGAEEKGEGGTAGDEDDDTVATIELEGNRVGIWVAQFRLVPDTFDLKHVSTQRFNFYQNLPGETASFCSYVRSLKKNDIVVATITDTAAARTRPLGVAVYEALRRLGAPGDMLPIKYRQAWSLVGYKGAEWGDAIVAQGSRSTLLRLEVQFGFDENGDVTILNQNEIQTSMSKILKIEVPESQKDLDESTLEKCRNAAAVSVSE
eukprot:g5413.t1